MSPAFRSNVIVLYPDESKTFANILVHYSRRLIDINSIYKRTQIDNGSEIMNVTVDWVCLSPFAVSMITKVDLVYV